VSFIRILVCLSVAMNIDDLTLHQAGLLLLVFSRRPALLNAETLKFFLIDHFYAFDQLRLIVSLRVLLLRGESLFECQFTVSIALPFLFASFLVELL